MTSNVVPEVIDIGGTRSVSPRLSVVGNGTAGTIKLTNLPPPTSSSTSGGNKSVNFGPGVDLLMNQNRARSGSPKPDIHLSDLKSIRAFEAPKGPTSTQARNVAANIAPPGARVGSVLPTPIPTADKKIKISVTESDTFKPPKVGEASGTAGQKGSTWDGFKKFNEIPVNPAAAPPPKPVLAPEEELKQKLTILRKLEGLEKKGIRLTKKYTMESSLAEIKSEYETIRCEKERSNSVKFQGKMMMACVSAIEYMNGKFDPFDIKLDGWGESINENLNDYDEVFAELHEKYGGKAKMSPEIKLIFMLGGSAAMIHMTNTMFKSSMPGMDDIMRQNPELMQQFTQAAANSMGASNPGFGNFMANVSRGGMAPPMGSPPGPPDYMRQRPPAAPKSHPTRPDVGMARGQPQFNDAVNMQRSEASIEQNRKIRRRPEMKGPSDITDILSGLKTKKVNIRDNAAASTISVEDVKELNKRGPGIQKRSKRRPRSERNTVSLDLI